MTDRLRIFDRKGNTLAEFQADAARSWALAKEGRCSFEIASNRAYATEKILEFGNYLLVESDILPAWVGIIDTPRGWTNSTIGVSAYTMEKLFSFRVGPEEEILTASAGAIFEKLIKKINKAEQTLLEAGDIYTEGAQIEETLSPETLDKTLKRIQENTLEEYRFRHSVIGGRLVMYGDWYDRFGKFTQNILNQSAGGGNIENPTMNEDGQIQNWILGWGDGETWADRKPDYSTNEKSVAKYGLRQYGEQFAGETTLEGIKTKAKAILRQNKYSHKLIDANVINDGRTFESIDIGNSFDVVLENMGFGGTKMTVRIIGMSYTPGKGDVVRCVMEEVVSDD